MFDQLNPEVHYMREIVVVLLFQTFPNCSKKNLPASSPTGCDF